MARPRVSYTRTNRVISLREQVSAWVKTQTGSELAKQLDGLLDEYKIKEPPPQEELPPKSDRETTTYSINDDLFEHYARWAAFHNLGTTTVLRGALSELFACREGEG